MIKIVSYKICPFVQRVTALLEAKNIGYTLEYIELKNKPQWFLDISPTGQVPILITEWGQTLFESDAIIEYIDEISEKLEKNNTPEQNAFDRAWSYQGSKHYLVQCAAMISGDKKTLDGRTAKLAKAFEKAEKGLWEWPYFKGANLSNIDIAWLPLLHRAAIIETHTWYDFIKDFPKIKAWQKNILKLDIVDKSVSEDFEEKFVSLYLAEDTYLWQMKSGNIKDQSKKSSNGSCGVSSCCG